MTFTDSNNTDLGPLKTLAFVDKNLCRNKILKKDVLRRFILPSLLLAIYFPLNKQKSKNIASSFGYCLILFQGKTEPC